MFPDAAQQPPPLQWFPAHPPVLQQPLLATVAAQSPTALVESCATWQPYVHEFLWKPALPDFWSVASGKERLSMQVCRLACGGGGLGGGGEGDGGGGEGDGGGGDGLGGGGEGGGGEGGAGGSWVRTREKQQNSESRALLGMAIEQQKEPSKKMRLRR